MTVRAGACSEETSAHVPICFFNSPSNSPIGLSAISHATNQVQFISTLRAVLTNGTVNYSAQQAQTRDSLFSFTRKETPRSDTRDTEKEECKNAETRRC
jgi:hypothetical protein